MEPIQTNKFKQNIIESGGVHILAWVWDIATVWG